MRTAPEGQSTALEPCFPLTLSFLFLTFDWNEKGAAAISLLRNHQNHTWSCSHQEVNGATLVHVEPSCCKSWPCCPSPSEQTNTTNTRAAYNSSPHLCLVAVIRRSLIQIESKSRPDANPTDHPSLPLSSITDGCRQRPKNV